MSIYVTDISVVFINFFYCLPSTLALIQPMPWYDKIAASNVWLYGYAMSMTTPAIDYGLYDYHMPVIYYNTVTM